MFTIKKSNLGEGTISSTAQKSCYFKGESICWRVLDNDNEEVVAFIRKKDAVMASEYFTKISYKGVGDPLSIFLKGCVYEIDDIEKVKEV